MTRYLCTQCGRGFHIKYFAAYHYEGALKGHHEILAEFSSSVEHLRTEGSRNITKACKRFHDMEIPDFVSKDSDK